jgi:hypothetical protein
MALKRPVSLKQARRSEVSAARRDSFCARMGGMRSKLTSAAAAVDPFSPINLALADWDCDMPELLKKKHVSKNVRAKKTTKSKKNPVPASSRAGASRRVSDLIDQASDLYERFSGHDPEPIGHINIPKIPRVGVAIGEVDGILYSTIRDGKFEKYIHKFHKKDRPMFIVSPDGKQLFLIGGNYTFTERGIVDASDK